MNAVIEFTTLDRLKGLLIDWAEWTKGYSPSLGAKSSSLIQSRCSHDFESLFSETERLVMKTIDTAIDDMRKKVGESSHAAIQRRYLGTDWRFPRDNYADMLDKAHDYLIVTLPKRNVIL